ncbi:GMC family oxidoreductase N-terminal domain-containing protein [uncultured Erythrobacter sp.]|uniref:GMC family oxidoreductase N-terminal domain-containing protein n=1 Tax=uncultured Erythrobacter sp. TaxID=263913 RepID=UPI002620EDE2|nr:GMC family oxidoreductase N-terminal domain-containing protein [uncultured Erythrobacter sp.]
MPTTSSSTLAALAPSSVRALGVTADGNPVVRTEFGTDGDRADYIITGSGAVALEGEGVDRSRASTVTVDEAMITVIAQRRVSFEHAYIEALFGGAPPEGTVQDVLERAMHWISILPDIARRDVKTGLFFLEIWLGRSFSELSIPERQARLTARIAEADFGIIRALSRLRTIFYSAYYQAPTSWNSIGFVPPESRAGSPTPVDDDVLRPVILNENEECDWLVIGSGAGGAAAAAALAAKGDDVIIIEKGDYWSTGEIRHRDAEQYAGMYVGGGLMTSSNREIAILQAECVGGSSLVNNGICFRPDGANIHPDAEDVIEHWRDKFGVQIDRAKLSAAFDFLWDKLEIAEITEEQAGPNAAHLETAWNAFRAAGHGKAGDEHAVYRRFEKNYGTGTRKCWGCGYCNSGCPYGRKNTVVETLLKQAQEDGARIAENTAARRINIGVHLRTKPVKSVQARQNGNPIRIRPKKGAIVAAGTGASSALLERLNFAHIGEQIACNLACPVIAKMPHKVDSWNAVQMGAYVDRGDHLIETWFHPPSSFSASVGGWFDEYVRRMQSYSNLVCLGILLPVSDIGEVKRGAFKVGLKNKHCEQLRRHVVDVVRMHFAGGAEEVYLPTSDNVTVRPGDDIEALVEEHLDKPSDFIVSTSHPQGGNVMGSRVDRSVVGSDLKVHGTGNLYVADASIFPSSIRINAQMFTMAMAHARFA